MPAMPLAKTIPAPPFPPSYVLSPPKTLSEPVGSFLRVADSLRVAFAVATAATDLAEQSGAPSIQIARLRRLLAQITASM